jgi:hypothetical protein
MMKYSIPISFLILIILMASCSRKATFMVIDSKTMLDSLGMDSDLVSDADVCNQPANYYPDTSDLTMNKTRTIRLIFHIMNSTDRKNNFSPEQAPNYFWTMLNNAHERLEQNRKMNLPEGNDTPVLKPAYRYKKVTVPEDDDGDGFLYHYDDELYYFLNKGRNRNNYRRDVINKYKVGGDSILNVFVMPHHPDSTASETYNAYGSGIALGNSIKVAGIYENGEESWKYATLINHEIGHVMGLKHSWIRRDGCDDTPRHNNCYQSNGEPPCDGLASNNMMDYNNSQMAITPCQLGIIHRNISKEGSLQRKLIEKNWCLQDTSAIIMIEDEQHWQGHRDSHHNIHIKKGGKLFLYCRLSMPGNSSITIDPGGELHLMGTKLHSDCGGTWNGIQVVNEGQESGKVFYTGEVVIEDVKPVLRQD